MKEQRSRMTGRKKGKGLSVFLVLVLLAGMLATALETTPELAGLAGGQTVYAETLHAESFRVETLRAETFHTGIFGTEGTAGEDAAGEEDPGPPENNGTENGSAGPQISISAPSAILMEASTGSVIFEQNADVPCSPASITKIMTLLLVFEALERGDISLEDEVMTSAHAQSMGGSQVFLEEGEIQTVDTMIKCIAVASGNDAAVAMAEFVAGSEEEFVRRMNDRAGELGMEGTHFEDCCGLSDSDGHHTTARDVAVMSRELITSHPDIYNYTCIWMEDITHNTARGSTPFTLSSTNKLLKQYQWTTGLKTGSTSKAKYCLSATARKNEIDLIAVVMTAPDYKVRFQDAVTLLNYGYSVSALYRDENQDALPLLPVTGGVEESVELAYQGSFSYLDVKGNDLNGVEKILNLPESANAPIQSGEKAGEAVYRLNGETIGTVDILFDGAVAEAVYKDYLGKVFRYFLL